MSEDKISMNHGAGGEVMANLISSAVLDNITKKSVNGGISLDALDDGATIPIGDYEIVVTTDGHTIDPLFFPGGDIGRISAAGTINDVSVMGAKPLAISNAIIMQEGFPIADLDRIMKSLNETCEEVDVAAVESQSNQVITYTVYIIHKYIYTFIYKYIAVGQGRIYGGGWVGCSPP